MHGEGGEKPRVRVPEYADDVVGCSECIQLGD